MDLDPRGERGLCSIVCPTFDHESFSAASLRSIFEQDYRRVEIVVVDDGSRDDNVRVLRETLAESPFPHVLLAQENTGNVGLNLNRGLAATRGEYITFLSLDDLLLQDCIGAKVPLFERSPSLAFAANMPYIELTASGVRQPAPARTHIDGTGPVTIDALLQAEYESSGTFFIQGAVFRRHVVAAIGGFDEDLVGDDLLFRTKVMQHVQSAADLEFVLLPEPGFVYRKHEANLHRNSRRQLETLLGWRRRYFPGRPFARDFAGRVFTCFDECVAAGRAEALQELGAKYPELAPFRQRYEGSWRHRRARLRRLFARRK